MPPQVRIRNLQPLIDQVRWAKSAREIAIVKAACDITTDAFKEAARQTKPGLWEYQIDAIVNYVFRRGGSERPAFLIVGSGPNSCILHHMSNDRQMQKDELLLIDKEIDGIEKLMKEPRSHPFRESWLSDAADTRWRRCNSLIRSHP
jgi:Xaa-Pro aminopeptidase